MILFTLYVLTLSSHLQKQYHNSFVIPASLKLYLMGITRSILQMHKLSLGEAQLFAPVHTAGGRQRRLKPGPKHLLSVLHPAQTGTLSSQKRTEAFLNSHHLCVKVLGPGTRAGLAR